MSRDWTPKEMLEADKIYLKNDTSFLDIARAAVFKDPQGHERPILTQEEYDICKQYRYLGSLLLEKLAELYHKLDNRKILEDYENILQRYIEEGTGDPDEPVIRWFNGQLDPNFYYNEINNMMLIEDIISKSRHLQKNEE